VVHTPERDRLRQELGQRGIDTGIHYPIPLHLQAAYQALGLGPGSFPHSETSAGTCLSLPMHPFITPEQVEAIGEACAAILG
jgi:dTDP-4-amino-4,6-dideoxygalactose transaminase